MLYKCLFCCLQGGMYVFQLFDYYACNGACILFLCVFESLALGWMFGRYADLKGTSKLTFMYKNERSSLLNHTKSFTNV